MKKTFEEQTEVFFEHTYCQSHLMPMAHELRNRLNDEDLPGVMRMLQRMERLAFEELARRLP